MKRFWMLSLGTLALALMAMPARTHAQKAHADLPGPIDSLQDLQDTGRMLFSLADENKDGQISQKEANDLGNLVVGGFFFRADANGDGTVTKEEAQQARETFLSQRPWVRYVTETIRNTNQPNANQRAAADTIANFLDTNNDGKLEASELRQAVTTATQAVFATADTNRDGRLSPAEVNAGIIGAARGMAQASFNAADTDRNGAISQAEFERALVQPSRTMFQVFDTNHDGQISREEANAARRVIASQMRTMMVPEPGNSARNLINSGRNPNEVSPVPNVAAPRAGQPATTPAPAQPQP